MSGPTFADPPADAADLQGLAWHRPAGRLVSVRRAQLGASSVPFLLLGVLIPVLADVAWVAIVIVLALLAGAAGADLLFRRRIASWRFAEREDDLVLQRGLLFIKLTVVPYGRMQFVDVVAGPFERMFGIASVHLHTAAAATDARIPGLWAADAARLRDVLTELGEARAAGL